MKSKFGREIALLTLPVLIVGGVAWWKSGVPSPKNGISKQKPHGTPRILVTPWKRVTVSSRDVAAGYDFAVETRPEVVSRTEFPIGVRLDMENFATVEKAELRYRRQGKWFVVKSRPDKPLVLNNERKGFVKNAPWISDLRLKIRLEDVPRNAQEIRLRGRLESTAFYSGTWPATPKKPAAVHIDRYGIRESRISPTFEIVIKSPTEPFPIPNVSRQEPVKVIEARFSRAFGSFELQLWVKRKQWAIVRNPKANLGVWDGKLFDGNGREIEVFSVGGTKQGNAATRGWTSYLRRASGPQLKNDEELLFSNMSDEAPRGGWKNIKLPLRLEAKISDDGSWPTSFKGTLREVKNYEVPKTRGD